MKILLTWYPLMDPGGLTNHIEQLGIAFKELGHTVHFVSLLWKERVGNVKPLQRDEVGVFGYPFDQRWGWHFPTKMRIPYKGKENMDRWKRVASNYDLVVWEIPAPPLNAGNRGNMDWPELYNLPKSVKQQIITHDGNILSNAHVLQVLHHINAGVGSTHVCGYEQAAQLGIPRFLIGTPQNGSDLPTYPAGYWAKRPRRWYSLQTFKRWKRVDDIVRAIPFMDETTECRVAGGGIEYYYMTSKTKVKPGYLDAKGRKIWDVALKHGMQYDGWISNAQRDDWLSKSRCVIDASWSHKYAQSGDYFNRVAFEGARMGCLPILRTRGGVASDSGKGNGWFSDGDNCIVIPWDAEPKLFAEITDWALSLPSAQVETMVEGARDLLRAIDRKEAAQHMINMAQGKLTGARGYCSPVRGKPSAALVNEHRRIMAAHFGG